MSDRFRDKVVLVSGAARGIGLATAKAFATEGAKVVMADIDGDLAEQEAEAIRAGRGQASAVQADVSSYDACCAMVGHAVETFGGLHIAFNNAAIVSPIYADFEEAEIADWDRTIDVDLNGVFYAMKAEVPALRASGGHAIVNTASMTCFSTGPGMAPYIAAKHGLAGLTMAVAQDLIGYGIRVNAVCPGFIDTPLLEPVLQTEEDRASVNAMIPAGRVGAPEEIARAVLFLASDDASYMVGALMRVDGGSTLK